MCPRKRSSLRFTAFGPIPCRSKGPGLTQLRQFPPSLGQTACFTLHNRLPFPPRTCRDVPILSRSDRLLGSICMLLRYEYVLPHSQMLHALDPVEATHFIRYEFALCITATLGGLR